VSAVLEILRAELSLAVAHCGRTSIHDLGSELVHVPAGWGRAQ
jgi:isopentenyl diphosphate isomerase/L-lactate dehydrogenase-like FMN-dependent dehydrogenase